MYIASALTTCSGLFQVLAWYIRPAFFLGIFISTVIFSPILLTAPILGGDIAPRGEPNGQLDGGDYSLLRRIAIGGTEPSVEEQIIGDVAPLGAPDGVINGADVLLLQRAILGNVVIPDIDVNLTPPTLNTSSTATNQITFIIEGTASPDSTIWFYQNSGFVASSESDQSGAFSVTLSLSNGSNVIYATESLQGMESAASNQINIVLDQTVVVNETLISIVSAGNNQIVGTAGSVEAGAKIIAYIKGGSTEESFANGNGAFSLDIGASTEKIASLVVIDSVGNTSNLIAVADNASSIIFEAGELAGSFDVDSLGSATYNIPLALPPGIAGMEPNLALNYSSGAGDGTLGVGWSLGGLSAITRCPQTLAQDGAVKGIDYDADDRFCLNGSRLVAISGNYGANNTEYRLEPESFSKIISHGISGSGPLWFEVWTKSGERLEFGNSIDSRITGNGAPGSSVTIWAVNRIEDRASNYQTIHYNTGASQGYTPSSIQYTGNAIAGLPPVFTVSLNYESRSAGSAQTGDTLTGYRAGVLNQVSQKLNGIVVSRQGTEVLRYDLAYDFSQATGRPRLTSVRQCAVDRCFSATTFDWQNPSTQFVDQGSWASTPEYAHLGPANLPNWVNYIRVGDPQGDGLQDILISDGLGDWGMLKSTGNGFSHEASIMAVNLGAIGGGSFSSNRTFVFDVNADGRTDILHGPNLSDEWAYGFSTGSSFLNSTAGGAATINPYPSGFASNSGQQMYRVMDVNGDSRLDFIIGPLGGAAVSGQWHVLLNNSTGGFQDGDIRLDHDGIWITAFGYLNDIDPSYSSVREADLNGDGLGDYLIGPHPSTGNWQAMLSTGTSFQIQPWITGQFANYFNSPERVRLLDANGDGLPDLLLGPEANGDWHLMISTGTGYLSPVTIPSPYGAWEGKTERIRVMDVNSDGRHDVLIGPDNSGNWHLMQAMSTATGTSYEDKGVFITGQYAAWASKEHGTRTRAIDVDGDGRLDIVLGPDDLGNWYVMKQTGPTPDFLASIKTGLDVETTIQYAPLNDTSVHGRGVEFLGRYPSQYLNGALHVVSAYQTSDGIGGTRDVAYSYVHANMDLQGRGFLGFRDITATDLARGLATTTSYYQSYPLTGIVSRQEIHDVASGDLLKDTLNYAETKQYLGTSVTDCTPPTTVSCPQTGNGNLRHFTYLGAIYEKTYEDNELISDKTTTTSYDSYGNVLTAQTTNLGSTPLILNTNQYLPADEANWILGRLQRSTVAQTLAGVTHTRTSEFEYEPSTGYLKAEIIEPTNPDLMLRTEYSYDDNYGNKTAITVSGSPTARHLITTRQTTHVYDYSQLQPGGNGTYTVTSTNAEQHSETKIIDARWGQATQLTGPNELVTHWQYDSFGRKVLETRADTTQSRWSYGWCGSACPYSGMQLMILSDGQPKTIAYHDQLGREVRSSVENLAGTTTYLDTQYNTFGQVHRKYRPYFSTSTATDWTQFSYDQLDRPTYRDSTSGANVEYRYITNPAGTLLRTKVIYTSDAGGYSRTITRTTRANGWVSSVRDYTDVVTNSHDPFGNLASAGKAGSASSSLVTMQYDLSGNKTVMDDPDMGHWEYQYDGLGQLRWQKDNKNQIVTQAYDKLGRRVSRSEDEGTTIWTYDTAPGKGKGKLAQVTTTAGNYSKHYVYDSLGRIASVERIIDNTSYLTATDYDDYSRVEAVHYPGGFSVRNLYDAFGHQIRVENANNGTEYFWLAEAANAEGQVTRETLGNGLITRRTFDSASGRIDTITTGSCLTCSGVQLLEYDFFANGNLKERRDRHAIGQPLTEKFTYDPLQRLETTEVVGQGIRNNRYLANGNILEKADVSGYQYVSSLPHAVTAAHGNTYTYDENGNMETGAGRTLQWTSFNKPHQISRGNTTLQFKYGPDRARYKQIHTASGQVTQTIYIGKAYEKVTVGGQTTEKFYISAAGRTVAIREKTQQDAISTKFLHQDHLGSTDVITDENGVVLERLSFSAFGERRASIDWNDPTGSLTSLQTTRGFTGHEQLDDVGLTHMNGRVYDPLLGRFISPDPIIQSPESLQSYNRYSYVLNNPLSLTDPSGFAWDPWNSVGDFLGDQARNIQRAGKEILDIPIVQAGLTIWAGLTPCGVYCASLARAGFTKYNGGSWSDAFRAGAISFASATAFGSLHDIDYGPGKVLAHGFVGGASSELAGGSFRDGFLSAGLVQAFAPVIGNQWLLSQKTTRVFTAAVVGGTASSLGGGKFANGAVTGAFGRLFNDELNRGKGDLVRNKLGERCNNGCTVVSEGGVHVESTGSTLGQDGITFRHDSFPLGANGNRLPVIEAVPGYDVGTHMSFFPGDKQTTYFPGFPNHPQTEHKVWIPPQPSYNGSSGGFDLRVIGEHRQ